MSGEGFPSPGGLFAPLSPLLEQIAFAPDLTSLAFLNSQRALYTRSGQRIPLPLMGLPGLTAESESAAYYDDHWQFRPGRRSRSV